MRLLIVSSMGIVSKLAEIHIKIWNAVVNKDLEELARLKIVLEGIDLYSRPICDTDIHHQAMLFKATEVIPHFLSICDSDNPSDTLREVYNSFKEDGHNKLRFINTTLLKSDAELGVLFKLMELHHLIIVKLNPIGGNTVGDYLELLNRITELPPFTNKLLDVVRIDELEPLRKINLLTLLAACKDLMISAGDIDKLKV